MVFEYIYLCKCIIYKTNFFSIDHIDAQINISKTSASYFLHQPIFTGTSADQNFWFSSLTIGLMCSLVWRVLYGWIGVVVVICGCHSSTLTYYWRRHPGFSHSTCYIPIAGAVTYLVWGVDDGVRVWRNDEDYEYEVYGFIQTSQYINWWLRIYE